MSGSSVGSPSKDSLSGSGSNSINGGGDADLPRDFSRLSLFSSASTTSQDEQFRSEGHAEHSLSCMQHYLQAGKLCDVILVAGNSSIKIRAHR